MLDFIRSPSASKATVPSWISKKTEPSCNFSLVGELSHVLCSGAHPWLRWWLPSCSLTTTCTAKRESKKISSFLWGIAQYTLEGNMLLRPWARPAIGQQSDLLSSLRSLQPCKTCVHWGLLILIKESDVFTCDIQTLNLEAMPKHQTCLVSTTATSSI